MENNENKENLDSIFRNLIDKSLKNMEEERDLSLERYRRQDETMISPEDFILQGKFAVDYLKVAADRSNAMVSVAKMLKDIIYKEGESNGVDGSSDSMNDSLKREISKYIHSNPDKKTD